MNTRSSSVSIVTVATVMILSAVAVRLLEQLSLSWVDYTSVTGGGFLSPHDLVSGNARTVTVEFAKLLLPGILLQALLIKVAIQALSPARVPYLGIALVLMVFQLGGAVLAHWISHEFIVSRGVAALSTTSLWTIFFATIISFALIVLEAYLIMGISRPRVGRYPNVVIAR